jgi:putative proteasome-type protease
MTYCVAMRLNRGLVFAADTRTSAGDDNVTAFRKLYYWRKPGQRVLVLCSAGNLGITQSVISLINEQLAAEPLPEAESLFIVPSLYRAARLVGEHLREVRRIDGPALAVGGELQRQLPVRRPDRRRAAAAVPHLSRGQLSAISASRGG